MTKPLKKMRASLVESFQVYPHDRVGTFESNYFRYREYAHQMLGELEDLADQVKNSWPSQHESSITSPSNFPELRELSRKRDRASDTTRIYAAMAIEGFLNFYGVLRLGDSVYEDLFERLGVIPKIRKLLLVCDKIHISSNHGLCKFASSVAESRNELVHPQAKEVDNETDLRARSYTEIPQEARKSVDRMEAFFAEFVNLVPEAKPHIKLPN